MPYSDDLWLDAEDSLSVRAHTRWGSAAAAARHASG